MNDTVNVPREVIERIEAHCSRLERDGSHTVIYGTPSAPTGNRYYNSDLARDLRSLLAAGPKAEPVLDLSDVRSKLSEIVDCSRALRHGGPEPEDLDELSNALDRATDLADDILADVVWADPSISPQLQLPEAPKVEREPAGVCPMGLAMIFHEAYERLAPSFGYQTREDTKTLDLSSPNGKLMVAVCDEIAGYFSHPAPASDELLEEERELDASDYDAIDRSLKYVCTVFAMHDLHEALTETMARMHSGYDWNSDPDGITLKQGDAIRRYETLIAKHKGPQS